MAQPEPSREVRRECDGYWEWFTAAERPPYRITGKYLFFSPDRERLVAIALEELESGAFHQAKTQMPGLQAGEDYVLCLYYRDDSRRHELAARYGGREGIRYRYWKSDAATRRGEYSERFLGSLGPEERRRFSGKGGDGA